jgi:hypothetical protein
LVFRPSSKVIAMQHSVTLRRVTASIRKHQVVREVRGIFCPWNEVVHFARVRLDSETAVKAVFVL